MFDPPLAQFLHALASPNRQRILLLFSSGGSLSVGQIAERVSLSMATVSAHLKELRAGGLLVSEKRGKEVFYAPDTTKIRNQLNALNVFLESCC
jgi:DNA-binding transcriptional ArsR family regulator